MKDIMKQQLWLALWHSWISVLNKGGGAAVEKSLFIIFSVITSQETSVLWLTNISRSLALGSADGHPT